MANIGSESEVEEKEEDNQIWPSHLYIICIKRVQKVGTKRQKKIGERVKGEKEKEKGEGMKIKMKLPHQKKKE